MKIFSLLFIVVVSFVLFGIGLLIPGTTNPLHIAFVLTGVLAGFIFYLLSFKKVIGDRSLTKGRRMFWIISIVCLPMIGNIFYLIISGATSSPQIKAGSAY